MAKGKKGLSKRQQRNLRIQQIVFILIGLMLIISMVLALIAH